MTYDIYLQTAISGANVRVLLLSRLVLCVVGIRLGVKEQINKFLTTHFINPLNSFKFSPCKNL